MAPTAQQTEQHGDDAVEKREPVGRIARSDTYAHAMATASAERGSFALLVAV